MTLAPCVHVWHIAGCGLVRIGQLEVSGFGVDAVRSPSSTLAWLGGRVLVSQPLSEKFAFGAHLDGLALLTPRTIYLNDLAVWSPGGGVVNVGFDLAVLFR